MCFLSSFSLSEWMLILTTVFTGGLLWIAWMAYNKLLIQEARKKQLEIVSQLVIDLVNSRVNLTRIPNNNMPFFMAHVSNLNVFDFAFMNISDKNKDKACMISDSVEDTNLSTVFRYLSNPLLPNSISNSINSLLRIEYKYSDTVPFPNGEILMFGDFIFTNYDNLRDEVRPIIVGGVSSIIIACKGIQKSITEWFSKHGVRDINWNSLQIKTNRI